MLGLPGSRAGAQPAEKARHSPLPALTEGPEALASAGQGTGQQEKDATREAPSRRTPGKRGRDGESSRFDPFRNAIHGQGLPWASVSRVDGPESRERKDRGGGGWSAAQERGKPLLGDWDSSRASWGAGLQQGPLPAATSSFLDHPSSP